MCCFNFNNNCSNIRYIRGPIGATGPQGPRGPIGPQGATGPQGPQGANAISNGIYASSGAQTVSANSIIPLSVTTSTPNSTLTVSNNAINLPSAGTYLVSYFVNGSVSSGTLNTSLYVNGVAQTNEVLISENNAGENSVDSKTILVTTTGSSTLSLYNTSEQTATILNASITAIKIA